MRRYLYPKGKDKGSTLLHWNVSHLIHSPFTFIPTLYPYTYSNTESSLTVFSRKKWTISPAVISSFFSQQRARNDEKEMFYGHIWCGGNRPWNSSHKPARFSAFFHALCSPCHPSTIQEFGLLRAKLYIKIDRKLHISFAAAKCNSGCKKCNFAVAHVSSAISRLAASLSLRAQVKSWKVIPKLWLSYWETHAHPSGTVVEIS